MSEKLWGSDDGIETSLNVRDRDLVKLFGEKLFGGRKTVLEELSE